MTKNYFTDSQVKEAVKVSLPWSKNMQLSIQQLVEFKALMNLAVEAAIGEAKAYLVDGRIEQGLFFDKTSAISMANANCGEFKSLHTVQELDN